MERKERKIVPFQSQKRALELLGDIVGEEITPLPEWQAGKLVLWYGGEWVQYDEYTDDETMYSRYPAGAYMQTIALNPSVITDPKNIASAALRINQQFDDIDFTGGFLLGAQCPDVFVKSEDEIRTVLFLAGEYGKAGHWPYDYEWETDTITWQLQPEQLGAAIASCVNPEWIDQIGRKMLEQSSQE